MVTGVVSSSEMTPWSIRMKPTDASLVDAARSGDRDAFAAIYDRYADPIHGFCVNRLRDRADAADATQDTFVRAATRLDQLRDPTRLRAWLFAIARNDCNRRLALRSRIGDPEALETMAADSPAPEAGVASAELADLVHDAAAGLTDRDQELLWLHLHHGLEGEALAAVLDVAPSHAYVMMSRLRERVGKSLGSLLVARLGREECTELAEVLGGWDGVFSLEVRSRVTRHVEGCDVCARRRAALVAPGSLLGVVPLVPPPSFVRDGVLDSYDQRGAAVDDDWTWRDDGFPQGVGRASPRRSLWWIAAGVAVIVVVIGAGLALVGNGDDTAVPATGGAIGNAAVSTDAATTTGTAPTTTTSVATTTTTTTTSTTTSAPPASLPALPQPPTTTVLVAPPPPPPPPPPPSPSPPPTTLPPPPTTTAAPIGPVLSLPTTPVDLGGRASSAAFTVANGGDQPLTWGGAVAGAAWSATPLGGTLAPGASTTITVSVDRSGLAEGPVPQGTVSLSSDGGAGSVRLLASVEIPPDVSILSAPSFVACSMTATVVAAASDPAGIASVQVVWPGGTVAMAPVGAEWSATIGPPPDVLPNPQVIRVIANDTRGNSAIDERRIGVSSGC